MKKCEIRKEPYEVPKINFLLTEVEKGFTGSLGVGTTDPKPGGDEEESLSQMEALNWDWTE